MGGGRATAPMMGMRCGGKWEGREGERRKLGKEQVAHLPTCPPTHRAHPAGAPAPLPFPEPTLGGGAGLWNQLADGVGGGVG